MNKKDELITKLIKAGHITLDEAILLKGVEPLLQNPYQNPGTTPFPTVEPYNPFGPNPYRQPYTGDTPWKQGIWYDNNQQFTC